MSNHYMRIRTFYSITIVSIVLMISIVKVAAESDVQIKNDIIANFKAAQSKELIDDLLFSEEGIKIIHFPITINNVIKKGKPAVRQLILLLDDDDPYIRTSALICLQEITNELAGQDDHIFYDKRRNEIIKAWKNWWRKNKDKEQIDWLIDSLNDKKDPIRIHRGITKLSELGNPKAVPYLKPFLKHPDINIQSYAITALAEFKDEASIPYLIQKLKAEEEFVRSHVFPLLKELTGLDFGYKPDDPIEARKKNILKWEQWLQKKQNESR